MEISQEALAIMAATVVGPIAAVLITRWRDNAAEQRGRRMNVFRTLMATRRIAVSPDHVGALNLVEVEFYGLKQIENAWREYIKHLYDFPEAARTDKERYRVWDERRTDLLTILLSEMALALDMPIREIDLRNGGYAPEEWAIRDWKAGAIQEYVIELALGRRVLPIMLIQPPNDSADKG